MSSAETKDTRPRHQEPAEGTEACDYEHASLSLGQRFEGNEALDAENGLGATGWVNAVDLWYQIFLLRHVSIPPNRVEPI